MPITNANIAYCKVVGQLVYTSLESNDADGYPNLEPFANKWIQFKPIPAKFTDLTHTPHALTVSTHFAPMRVWTDADGVIVGDPNPSNKWAWIFAGDDPDTNPTGFDYEVTFQDDIFPRAYTPAPSGGTINMASVMNTVGNPGELTGPAQAAAAAAASSAAAAAASAASIDPGEPNGVATLNSLGKLTASQVPDGLGGGGGGVGSFADLDDVSELAKDFNSDTLTTAAQMREVIGAVAIGTSSTTAAAGDIVAGLVTDVATLEAALDTLSDVVSDNGSTLSGASTDISALTSAVDALESLTTSLSGTLSSLSSTVSTLSTTVAAQTTAINALDTRLDVLEAAATAPITMARLPANTVVTGSGSSSPRVTSRTDLFQLWKANNFPVDGLPGDIWLNAPSS